jgi:hypothetical protein
VVDGARAVPGWLRRRPWAADLALVLVLSKLAAHDRAQLVVLASETGLVRPGWL